MDGYRYCLPSDGRMVGTVHPQLPRSVTGLFFLFLFFSSGAIVYTTAQNVSSIQTLALQSLQSTAFALASSAENVLRIASQPDTGQMSEIFSDRIVAYASIVLPDGTIFFHTNPALIGSRIAPEEVDRMLGTGIPSGRRITLQTGIPAYEMDYMLHTSDGTAEILRLVLHTSPADRIVSRASRVWWTVGGVILLVWTTGVMLWHMFARYLRLQAEFERGKQMALIGRMTAVLSHEIRNALSSVKGYVQLMNETTSVSDVNKQGIAAILIGAGRIESLVDNLLLFSREETYDTKTVDVMEVLRNTLRFNAPSWKGQVVIEGGKEMNIAADTEKLERVIANGVRNGLQAMGEGGTVRLSAKEHGGWVYIMIEDTGRGIPAEDTSRLFTPFYTTKTDGTGLGLAYSEKVVKGMGGQINLSNRDGGPGAVLTIRLPRVQGVVHG
jgi:two-component system, NtrC family, sensor histidine kinase HydH